MNDLPDARLLEQFVHSGSEEAFTTLVERYIALVHSTALRHTDNSQQAQDITQAVFIVLAHKAGSLGHKLILPGWLYHTTRLTAANIQRADARRLRREQEAFMQSMPQEHATDSFWCELSPQLDKAMGTLKAGERDALVLRYFQNMSTAQVGQSLGLTQNTAQKRICRGLEKLHRFFSKRGVNSTTAIIAQAISINSVQAVPAAMAKSVTSVALAKGATASSSTLTLFKGALKIMAWTKVKSAIVAGAAVLLAVGTATVGVNEYRGHWSESWELPPFPDPTFDGLAADERLAKAPSELRILPSKYDKQKFYLADASGYTYINADGLVTTNHDPWHAMGVGLSLDSIVRLAYATEPVFPEWWRTIYRTEIPAHPLYDYVSTLPESSRHPLQELIRKKYGITAKWELVETNVLAVRVSDQGLQGFHPAGSLLSSQHIVINSADQRMNYYNGWLHKSIGDKNGIVSETYFNSSIDDLIRHLPLEGTFQTPIVNETGLTNRYDFTLVFPHYDRSWRADGWKTAWENTFAQQLGLEFVPTQAAVEMLVVDKAE